jgi:hypothetical protein
MPIDLKDLARRGAQARLAELVAEMDSILGAFPDLGKAAARPTGSPKGRNVSAETKAKMRAAWARRKAAAAQGTEGQTANAEPTPKKKRTMSAEARVKIGAAQRKRWRLNKAGRKR